MCFPKSDTTVDHKVLHVTYHKKHLGYCTKCWESISFKQVDALLLHASPHCQSFPRAKSPGIDVRFYRISKFTREWYGNAHWLSIARLILRACSSASILSSLWHFLGLIEEDINKVSRRTPPPPSPPQRALIQPELASDKHLWFTAGLIRPFPFHPFEGSTALWYL